MLKKHFNKKNKSEEYGLSMIELLAVIIIIGILSSTALAVILNKRAKANIAAAESDLRNAVILSETALVSYPNAVLLKGEVDEITASNSKGVMLSVDIFSGSSPTVPVGSYNIPLSAGVFMKVEGDPSDSTDGYSITVGHINSGDSMNRLVWSSVEGFSEEE